MLWLKKRMSLWIMAVIILVFLGVPSAVMAGKISDGSSIGGIPLENLEMEEAKQVMEEAVITWQNGPPLLAQNEYETIEIPRAVFQFDVNASLLELEEKMARSWCNFFKKQKSVQQRLIVDISAEEMEALNLPEHIDVDKTFNKAIVQARSLSDEPIPLTYINGADIEQENVAAVDLAIPDISLSKVRFLADKLNGRVLESDNLYSFLDEAASLDGLDSAEKELSFVASGLYQLALQSNMEIIERHAQDEVASYTNAGLDANVDWKKNLDLQLYITNDYAYTLEADVEEGNLKLSLQAMISESDYEYSIENEMEITPRKVYRYNGDLPAGAENVVQQGRPGKSVEVYRITKEKDNAVKNKELIERDFYPPSPEIIEAATIESDEDMEDEAMEIEGEPAEEEKDADSIIHQIQSDLDQQTFICEEDDAACAEAVEFYENGEGNSAFDLILFLMLLEMWDKESDANMLDELNRLRDEMKEEDTEQEMDTELEAEFPEEKLEEKKEEAEESIETEKKIMEEDTGSECTDEKEKEQDTEEVLDEEEVK